jgi:hypothetical protein
MAILYSPPSFSPVYGEKNWMVSQKIHRDVAVPFLGFGRLASGLFTKPSSWNFFEIRN